MSTTRPPTLSFDALPSHTSMQRLRLVRSTHKLTKLLGETPVPQPTLSPEPLPLRNKSRDIIQERPRSPIVSLTKKLARTAIQVAFRRDPDTNSRPARAGTSSRGRDRSPAFFDAPNPAPGDSPACHLSPVSSNSPRPIGLSSRRRRSSLTSISGSESIDSLTEWKYEEERAARSRRKRLSKLTRYLGETIPPDMILPKITYSEPTTAVFAATVVVPNPSTMNSVDPPLGQGTIFSSTTLPSPIPKSPKPAVVRTVDSFVGSIGRSLSHRINTDVTSPRLLARRLRRSRSESTLLSLSQERLTLLRPDTYFAADDYPDTPVLDDIRSVVPP